MKKNNLLFAAIGLIIGLVIGFSGANYLNRNAMPPEQTAQNQFPASPPVLNQTVSPQERNPRGGMLPDIQIALDKAENEPENYEAQIKAGEMYARIGNFEKALEFFQKAQRVKPNNFEANVSLGNAFFDARQFENAETYYEKALEINPDEANVLTDLGTTLVERKNPNYERAVSLFEKALKIKPNHEPTIYNLGIAYLRMGEKDNARQTLAQLKEANPNSDLIARLEQVINKQL